MKTRTQIVFLVLVALLAAFPAASQVFEKGTISGTVLDPSGALVPNAAVKVLHVATGAEREATTDPDGRYAVPLLSAGEYRIEVSASGFATSIVKGVRLAVGQGLIQDVTLQVAAVGQTVEVTAETGPIDKSEALQKVTIDETYVSRLPISGRDFRDFVNLAGTADTSPALRSPVRLGGQQGEYTGLLIDGVDNRNSFFGEWFGSLETKNFTVPQDAVQEFQVREGGFSAEFGHATGGLINVVTKSGTNDWHGTVHWFFQTNSLIASTFVEDTGTAVPPSIDTRHQFGGTIGGPIKRDKAFVFFALDDQQQKGPLTAIFGEAETNGISVLCRPTPSNCPLPAVFGGGNLTDLEGGTKQRQDLFAPLLKFDYRITDKHTATTRFNYTRNETDGFTGFAGSQTFVLGRVENNFENFVNEGFAISQSLTSVISPRSVNEFRVAFSQEKRPRRTRADFTQETVIADGTGNFGPVFFLPIDSEHTRWQFLDNFSRTFGKHDVKLGVDLNSNATNQIFVGFGGGQYNFASLADFTGFDPVTGTFNVDAAGNPIRRPLFLLQRVGINGLNAFESGFLSDFWQHELSFYVQDNWKIHPRVTLNLGLRWDGIWNPKSEFGLPPTTLPVGRPQVTSSGVTVGLGQASADVPNDFNNWAPRVGVAWDATGDGKTIVRGGLGIYYAASPTIFFAGTLAGPGLRSAVLFIPFFGSPTDLLGCGLTYPNILPSTGDPCASAGPPSIDYVDPDFESARVFNIQFGVEREILPDLSISGTYTHNRSQNLRTGGFFSTPWDRNLDPTGVTFDSFGRTIGAFNLPRLDPTIDNANAIASFGKARYHAFILQVKKTYRQRYQFGINYAVSKNRDNASSDRDTDAFNGPSDPFNFLALDYGRSQLDITHQFSAYGYFLLPADIEFSTRISARSGRVFPVWDTNCAAPGVVAPFGLGGTGAPFSYQNPFQCSNNFNQIRPVANGELLPRYPLRNDNLANWDIRFGRAFPLRGERLQLRATFEIFNVTDSQNFFTNPTSATNALLRVADSDPMSPTFGTLIPNSTFRQKDSFTSTRAAQFGLKFIF